jgi:hypothetical protein
MVESTRWLWASLFLVACGGESAAPNGAAGTAGTGGNADSGSTTLGWQDLISGSWQVPSGSEIYTCVRTTLDHDVSIRSFEAINPRGTHHTVLTVGPPSAPDGQTPCNSFEQHNTLIFGSGVGTNPFEFPEGVAVRLHAGQQLLLNLHLFNTSGADITGTSGTRALVVEPSEVTAEAESILAGTLSLTLPPKEETKTLATCTINSESTLFGVQPHMHQLGTHMKVVARVGGVDQVIHDGDYDFGEQPIYPMAPLKMGPGDTLHVECTHMNTTDAVVNWGESSKAEMCHGGVYRYPAANSGPFFCAF